MVDALANFANSTVATAPSPATSGTSLVVASGAGALFPVAPFWATIWPTGVQPTAANAEIVRVTAVSTDTFTITRAQDGSTARSVVVTDQIAQTVTAGMFAQYAPQGNTNEVQYKDSTGSLAAAANVEIENGILRLPTVSMPSAPASGGLDLFGRDVAGRALPAFIGPSGLDSILQPSFARNAVGYVRPCGNGTTVILNGINISATGTATGANVATTNRHTWMRRIEYLVTTAATTAVAGIRTVADQYGTGSGTNGGFTFITRWGPATGTATTTNRFFCGFIGGTAAPTDVETSSRVNILGMGWDAADTNIQWMNNDGTGTATKVDLGSSFPVPTVDRTSMYELAMFCPPGGSTVTWLVTDLTSGATATGTVTTDMPSSTTLLMGLLCGSVGGTSSVIGVALAGMYIETDY